VTARACSSHSLSRWRERVGVRVFAATLTPALSRQRERGSFELFGEKEISGVSWDETR